MLTLALDVDGVLLDPDRNGDGHWTNELTAQFGIERAQLRESFFMKSWDDVVNGRRTVEDGLAEALALIGATVDVESVLSYWFDTDYAPIDETFELARRAAAAGCRVVLATNQEHRRADYLRRRIGAAVPLERVIYSADVGYQKHDPRFFEIASERLRLNLNEHERRLRRRRDAQRRSGSIIRLASSARVSGPTLATRSCRNAGTTAVVVFAVSPPLMRSPRPAAEVCDSDEFDQPARSSAVGGSGVAHSATLGL